MSENSEGSVALFAKEIKVRTLQYKVTVFLIALGFFIARPFLTDVFRTYTQSQQEYATITEQVGQKQKMREEIIQDLSLLQEVGSGSQRNTIIQCYNTTCQNLPEPIRDEPARGIFKAFLQLQQEGETQFAFDQKIILAYINEFLVKTPQGSGSYGQIQHISFQQREKIANTRILRIPMSVTLTFPTKEGLLGFLRNAEQLISPTFPMLALIQSVTYDIVKTDMSQDVVVLMNVYMLE